MNQQAQTSTTTGPSGTRTDLRTTVLLVAAIGLFIGLMIAMVKKSPPVSCPDELIGAWYTSARGYEDGMLVFTNRGVAFSVGAEHLDTQAIRRVEAIPEGTRILYTVIYGDSRTDEQILSFYYHTKDRTITFTHQSHLVWVRKAVES
jgi:hypothetical protein